MNQGINFGIRGFIVIFLCLTGELGAQAADKSLHLLVTPKGTAKFHCSVDTARVPEIEELGQTAFRVNVFGGTAPYSWRLPLYQENNGTNDIATAEIGKGRPDANHGFYITVPTGELGRIDMRNPPRLEVRSHDGESASCKAPLSPAIAKSEPAILRPAQASVTQ